MLLALQYLLCQISVARFLYLKLLSKLAHDRVFFVLIFYLDDERLKMRFYLIFVALPGFYFYLRFSQLFLQRLVLAYN